MNSNTKIIALTLLATTIIAAWATFATNNTSTWITNVFKQWQNLTKEQKEYFGNNKIKFWKWWMWFRWHWKWCWVEWMMWWFWIVNNQLTTEEKTKLESMTDTEKQAFFEAKRVEGEKKNEANEVVIDKLLNWEVLTDADKVIVNEIKVKRAEMKAKKIEMQEMKALIDKQNAGTTLTTDEQAKLDAFKAKMPQKWWRWFDRD